MCIPIDKASLQCWLRHQLNVIQAWRDEALMQLQGETALAQALSGHHAWLMRELRLLGDDPTVASVQSNSATPIGPSARAFASGEG
ncbi:MAG: hypothetical protein R3C52_09905 [Hyphomonadaceae bacterium]